MTGKACEMEGCTNTKATENMGWKAWEPHEDNVLRKMVEAENSWADISDELDRSEKSCQSRWEAASWRRHAAHWPTWSSKA